MGKDQTTQEVDEHMMAGHVPFRSWCKHCVMGRAKDDPHFKGSDEVREAPRISIDYMWLHENAEERRERKKKEADGVADMSIEAMPVIVVTAEESTTVMA